MKLFIKWASLAPVILLSILSVHSCRYGTVTETETTPAGVPPSISGTSGGKKVILLEESASDNLNIETFTVIEEPHQYVMEVPGVVFPSPDHYSIISTPLPGRIIELRIREGEDVHVGEILFRIESLELGVMVSEYLQAIAEEEYHRTRFERIRRLSDQEISSESELDRAMSDLKRATTIAKATYSKLRAAGISGEEIARYRKQENIEPVLNIRSPISGTLDMRRVDLGQQVSEYQDLGTVIDNSHVMVRGYLSPEDGRYVKPGDSVFVHRRVETSLLLPAVISSVNPGLDEANRSAIINIYLELEGNWPRPGENVKLDIRASTFESLMAIPLRALTYDGNEPVVFIRTGKNAWEERSIEIGEMRDTSAVVISGLDVGEKLAVSQVFSLKALSRIEQIAEE